jgi:hypothetical protein
MKTLQGLLNKMSDKNAATITAQIISMTTPCVDIMTQSILEQACKHSTYFKQYTCVIKGLLERRGRCDFDVVQQTVCEYIQDFKTHPFFIVEHNGVEQESYDDFCNRVKAKNHSLGRLKVVIDILSTMSDVVAPEEMASFVVWYMNHTDSILGITDCLRRDLCCELFLDGVQYIVDTCPAQFQTWHKQQLDTIRCAIGTNNMPVKLKFKVMDIEAVFAPAPAPAAPLPQPPQPPRDREHHRAPTSRFLKNDNREERHRSSVTRWISRNRY